MIKKFNNVLVIGLGDIGMMYDYKTLNNKDKGITSHCKATVFHPDFSLAGGVDQSFLQRELFKKGYKKNAFKEISSAMVKLNPEIIIIATPTKSHFDCIRECLKYNSVKIILCEKPLSINPNDCLKIVQECRKKNVKLFVNYIRKSDIGVIEIKRRINNHEISHPIKGSCWYSKGIYNNGSHFFNLCEYWLGPFKKGKLINKNQIWPGQDPDIDFMAYFKNGSVFFQSAWEDSFSHNSLELLSKNGRLVYENAGRSIYWQNIEEDQEFIGYKLLSNKKDKISNSMKNYQFQVMNMLSRAIKDQANTLCTGEEALKIIQNLNIIEENIQND